MIKPVSRHDLLQINLVFAAAIIAIQDSKYNPRKILHYEKVSNTDEISQEEIELYDQRRDVIDLDENTAQFYSTFALCTDTDNMTDIPAKLSANLKQLMQDLNQKQAIFILEFNTPWDFQHNDFPKVKIALSYLYSLGMSKDFSGGFIVETDDIETFFSHIFWLIRCNAGMPDLYFSGENIPIIISCDRFGNLLCDSYNQNFESQFKKKATSSGFSVVPWQEAIKHGYQIPCREINTGENK